MEEEEYGSESSGSSSSSSNSQSKSRGRIDEDGEDGGSRKSGSQVSGKSDFLKNQWDSKTIKRNEKVIQQVIADIVSRQRT